MVGMEGVCSEVLTGVWLGVYACSEWRGVHEISGMKPANKGLKSFGRWVIGVESITGCRGRSERAGCEVVAL